MLLCHVLWVSINQVSMTFFIPTSTLLNFYRAHDKRRFDVLVAPASLNSIPCSFYISWIIVIKILGLNYVPLICVTKNERCRGALLVELYSSSVLII